ncbi:MAG: GIY-YIG nuclease family protein [Proteobacteria bacterium]|nr:GIY-YIG nuclease family protein [Pseudomonadota bacterium]
MSHDAVGIIGHASYFAIRYRHPGFGKEYLFNCDSRLFEKERGEALMRKLRLITARNRITHEILNAVFMRQRAYFHSGSPLDLKPLSRAELALTIRAGNGADPVIDASRISRFIDGKTVVVPSGGEKPLKFFFPTGRDIHRRAISALMDEERQELAAGKTERPLNDGEIRDRLKERHGLAITRRQAGFCRQELGIPNLYRRKGGGGYSSERRRFSAACRLDTDSVKKNAPSTPGVYELSLAGARIEYPGGADSVFYIGSAGNIRKRLKEHLKPYNKNGGIMAYLEKYDCFFRYIALETGWHEEKKLYDLFAADFGAPPRCNRASPRGGGREVHP